MKPHSLNRSGDGGSGLIRTGSELIDEDFLRIYGKSWYSKNPETDKEKEKDDEIVKPLDETVKPLVLEHETVQPPQHTEKKEKEDEDEIVKSPASIFGASWLPLRKSGEAGALIFGNSWCKNPTPPAFSVNLATPGRVKSIIEEVFAKDTILKPGKDGEKEDEEKKDGSADEDWKVAATMDKEEEKQPVARVGSSIKGRQAVQRRKEMRICSLQTWQTFVGMQPEVRAAGPGCSCFKNLHWVMRAM